MRERAPIEAVAIRVVESAPRQYFADVTSGLPSGCARFEGYTLIRAGNNITVTVWNTMPSGAVACTMIYGVTTHAVPLGADFVTGVRYALRVNDAESTFTGR